jgi:energy-coupling factor transporter ATP-binding protein EcfA2
MDSFIKIIPQKKSRPPTLHQNEIDLLEKYIRDGKNVFICGPTGCGKTFIVNSVLETNNTIELHSELFQKKSTFMNLIGDTSSNILIDGYDSSIHGHKQIIDRVSEQNEKVTRGSVIVTSTNVHMVPNFKLIIVPRRTPDAIFSLACDNPRARMAADECQGDIRNFFDYMSFSHVKDVFRTSKDIVVDILSKTSQPFDLSQTIHEHGHVCDVIFTNYTRSHGCNTAAITESLSQTDIYDNYMYKGDWGCMPFFVAHAMAIPKLNMGLPIKVDDIQPGSIWTKYGNYKMRSNKLRTIQSKNQTKIGIDELNLLRKYAISGDINPLMEYNLEPLDFDIMNHLAVGNKLKPAEVSKVKKKMRSVINE